MLLFGQRNEPYPNADTRLGFKSSILLSTSWRVVQPVTWRDRPITSIIQLLFKLGGRIPDLGPRLYVKSLSTLLIKQNVNIKFPRLIIFHPEGWAHIYTAFRSWLQLVNTICRPTLVLMLDQRSGMLINILVSFLSLCSFLNEYIDYCLFNVGGGVAPSVVAPQQ